MSNLNDPPSPEVSGDGLEVLVSRRDLRKARASQGSWGRKAIAAGAGLALAVATYGVVAANTGEVTVASLSASGSDSVVPRVPGASRSVDRLPLEGGTFRTIVVTVDGETTDVSTSARTLAEALADAGIEVGYNDIVDAPMNGEPTDVTITRVVESIETVEEKVAHKTIRKETSSLLKGQERVQTKGRDGLRTATKRVLRQGDEIISEEILAQAVGSEPVTEVILVGTGVAPKPAARSTAPARAATSSAPAAASPVPAGGSRGIARGMLSSYGWGDDQWGCLDRLWQRESGWNHRARNPYSGAYGIPQSLPASKMASAGADYLTNPATQIRWGLGYIKDRYGSPCGAWGHSQRTGWY